MKTQKAPIEAIRQLLAEKNLLQEGKKLLCAVSGGADSMALLWGLCLLREESGFSLQALHIQHGLRGMESAGDEAFVRSFCREHSIPLTVRGAGLSGSMADAGIETRARESRLRIFREEAQKADALLLAHHRDDQTETILLHLLRGAGTDGLCGMAQAKSENGLWILRPFLSLPKAELLHFLEAEGIPHREDSSNRDCVTPRNRLRLEILPQLETMFPGAGGRIAAFSEILAPESAFLSQQAQEYFRKAKIDDSGLYALRIDVLRHCPQVLKARILRLWFREACRRNESLSGEQNLSHEETSALMALLDEKRGFLNLPHGLRAEKGKWLLNLNGLKASNIPSDAEMIPIGNFFSEEARLFRCFGTDFKILSCMDPLSVPSAPNTVFLPLPCQNAVLRHPRPGDRIQPMGASGHKPYRRYLTDIRMDPCLRSLWPVLACGDDILWVPGICTAQALHVSLPIRDCWQIQTLSGLIPTILKEDKEND